MLQLERDLPLTEPSLSPAGPDQGLGLQCCHLYHLKLMLQPSKSDDSMSGTQSSLRDACKGNCDIRYVDQAWYHGKSERTGLKGLALVGSMRVCGVLSHLLNEM